MAKRQDARRALAGSVDNVMHVIIEVLEYFARTESPSPEFFLARIRQKYAIHEITADSALQVLERGGLIAIGHRDATGLTDVGKQACELRVERCDTLLAAHFLKVYRGLSEILEKLDEAGAPLDQSEITNLRGNRFSPRQFRDQIHWLIALHRVDYADVDGLFKITNFGKALLVKLKTAEVVKPKGNIFGSGEARMNANHFCTMN